MIRQGESLQKKPGIENYLLAKFTCPEKKFRIEISFDKELPKLEGIPRQILDAFLNILKYFFQAASDAKESDEPFISLKCKKEGSSIVVEINDDGNKTHCLYELHFHCKNLVALIKSLNSLKRRKPS